MRNLIISILSIIGLTTILGCESDRHQSSDLDSTEINSPGADVYNRKFYRIDAEIEAYPGQFEGIEASSENSIRYHEISDDMTGEQLRLSFRHLRDFHGKPVKNGENFLFGLTPYNMKSIAQNSKRYLPLELIRRPIGKVVETSCGTCGSHRNPPDGWDRMSVFS